MAATSDAYDGLVRRRTWPMVPPAPIAVVVLGVALAAVIGAIGLHQLRKQGEASASQRADLMATTVAARIVEIPNDARHDLLDRASRRSGASMWLVGAGRDGARKVLEDLSRTPYPIDVATGLTAESGEIVLPHGTARYRWVDVIGAAVGKSPGESLRVIAAVDVADPPVGEREMIAALFTLTALLVGIAAGVAYAVARDVRLDVDDLARRIREIASRGREATDRAQDLVPVQALDEVGELASAFDALVERFAVAEKTYADALARMEEIDRERSTFLATVSHELRSPLNAILGFADILLSEVDGPLVAEAREEVAVIKQSGLHLLGLINDILELSAIASGQLRLQRSEVDLVPIAEQVVREAIGVRGDKPVALRVVASSPHCLAHVDPRRVRQILTNLVGNAVKFTPRGEVSVSIERDEYYATVRVRDTGPGIRKEERESIFDEYQQGGDRRSRRRGTGLGLAIARRLALMHGGAIRLESEVGVGSEFVLRLPLGSLQRSGPGLADDSGAHPSRELARALP